MCRNRPLLTFRLTFRPEENTKTGDGKAFILERNIYYYRNVDKDAVDKYVTPYRLTTAWELTSEEQLELYKNGEILYISCLLYTSSFGRARPCQGRGGGFEPRNPLHSAIFE